MHGQRRLVIRPAKVPSAGRTSAAICRLFAGPISDRIALDACRCLVFAVGYFVGDLRRHDNLAYSQETIRGNRVLNVRSFVRHFVLYNIRPERACKLGQGDECKLHAVGGVPWLYRSIILNEGGLFRYLRRRAMANFVGVRLCPGRFFALRHGRYVNVQRSSCRTIFLRMVRHDCRVRMDRFPQRVLHGRAGQFPVFGRVLCLFIFFSLCLGSRLVRNVMVTPTWQWQVPTRTPFSFPAGSRRFHLLLRLLLFMFVLWFRRFVIVLRMWGEQFCLDAFLVRFLLRLG